MDLIPEMGRAPKDVKLLNKKTASSASRTSL